MNPSAVSAEPQPEIPIWHPGVCTVYNSGLVTRPDVQSGQYGLESDITYNQLAAVAATRSIRDQEAEGKPNIITDILPNLRPDYNVTLANNILTPTTLTQVSWGLLNFAGENMEGPFYSFYPSSLPGLGALNHIEANADFSAGNTNAYADTRCGPQEHQNQNPLLGFLNWGQRRFHDVVKREFGSPAEYATSLGLNLSGKPYFPAEDTTSFFKRFRSNSPVAQVPSCQAGGCKADLRLAKHYHRRHKVCEFHSKAATVMIGGQTHRFCQQCSRFHALSEFDEGKRSCRKRLADHNRRRRKPQPTSTSASDNPTTNQSAVEKNGELEENDNKQASGGTSDTKSTASPATAKIENLISVSVASSAPTTSQMVTKQQTSTVDDYQKKEITSKDVFQKSGASNLSPSTSVEAKGNYPQPSAGECNIRPISWLKGASSTSKSIDTVSRSILNDNGNPSRPLLPPLSLYTTQNLLPISARKEPMVKPSQWIVEDTASAESYAPFTNHQDVHASTEIRDGELNTLDSQDFKAVQRIKNDHSVQISLGYPQGQRETKAGPTTGNEQVRDVQGINPLHGLASYI